MSKRQLKLFCTFAEDGFFDRGRAYLECSSWRKSEPKRWKVKELLAIEKIINKISIGGENETT
tara:strand:- start:771 stop:959 length:189 start_codon:yes stop_codon:yes gene_type:complete